jgi:hypothetical protein
VICCSQLGGRSLASCCWSWAIAVSIAARRFSRAALVMVFLFGWKQLQANSFLHSAWECYLDALCLVNHGGEVMTQSVWGLRCPRGALGTIEIKKLLSLEITA